MAQIETSTLRIGSNDLILKDAQARQDISNIAPQVEASFATDTASGSIASFPDGADNVPIKSLKVNIEPVQSGSGDPSPTNVRAISGRTWAKVAHSDIQLFNPANTEIGKNWTGGAASNRAINRTPVEGGKRYRVRRNGNSLAFGTVQLLQMNGTQNLNSTITIGYNYDGYVDALSNCTHFLFQYSKDTDITVSDFKEEIMSVSNNYCNIISIDWTSKAGTVYGGTLNVTTGVLTVDRVIVTLDGSNDETWGETAGTTSASGSKQITLTNLSPDAISHSESSIVDGISNYLKPSSGNLIWNGTIDNVFNVNTHYVGIRISGLATAQNYRNYLAANPLVICYKLATSQTVQLSANEVKTLLGQNNIWADCGNTEVEYRADTKLYIEKLTAPTEDDMIADHAISSGSFFMVGNTLYRATTAIASGATITVGTNATKLSLSDALNALA